MLFHVGKLWIGPRILFPPSDGSYNKHNDYFYNYFNDYKEPDYNI